MLKTETNDVPNEQLICIKLVSFSETVDIGRGLSSSWDKTQALNAVVTTINPHFPYRYLCKTRAFTSTRSNINGKAARRCTESSL